MLEFAALSTVCDVMELKDENRILVKEGLKRIQKGYNEGLKALMEVNDIAPDRLSAIQRVGRAFGIGLQKSWNAENRIALTDVPSGTQPSPCPPRIRPYRRAGACSAM